MKKTQTSSNKRPIHAFKFGTTLRLNEKTKGNEMSKLMTEEEIAHRLHDINFINVEAYRQRKEELTKVVEAIVKIIQDNSLSYFDTQVVLRATNAAVASLPL